MEHKLPDLPYKNDSLAPVISKETFEYHYGKHHAAYVSNLNKLIKGTDYEDMTLDDLLIKARGPVFNNASQHWNHSFFWKCMKPQPGEELDEGFMLLVEKNFGSIGELKDKFTQAAVSLFGSGWIWLADNMDETLSIISSPNAGNPLTEGKKPLLVLDVWEHAYYIDYRNRRADYAEAFWGVIDWGFVMRNHRMISHIK